MIYHFGFSIVFEVSIIDLMIKMSNENSNDRYGFDKKLVENVINVMINPLTIVVNRSLR